MSKITNYSIACHSERSEESPGTLRISFTEPVLSILEGFRMTMLWCIVLAILSVFTSCGGSSVVDDGDDDTSERSDLIAAVENWAYQLQNIDPDAIGASNYDLVVIDYSADGSDDEAFSADDVDTMRGANDKLVISYMSIGEAEDYRYYFDADADYIDEENPEWPGNYKVHYWEDAWQEVILGYVDKLIAAGFDGAYLDIIDGYEYYGPGGDSGEERDTAADDMAAFVIRIAEYARESDENFLIFPQNGAGIINDAADPDAYFTAIDGIGAEDTFYFGDEENDNDLDPQDATIENLDAFVAQGKLVLAVDYLTDADKIDDFYDRAATQSYIPYTTTRELDALTENAGHEP